MKSVNTGNTTLSYDVHNDSGKYDENYSESSSEFMVAAAGAGFSHAQLSILSAIKNKIKGRYSSGDYNDCSYPQVYDQDK